MASYLHLLFLSLLSWHSLSSEPLSDEQQGITKTAANLAGCQQQLAQSRLQTYAGHYILPYQFELLSWNIYKAQIDGLVNDLNTLNESADIVLLQEAIKDSTLTNLKPYWRFAKGYKSGNVQSGVMTLSRWPATVHCTLTHVEPWLRSPKATNIVEYALPNQQLLLSVNLHAINFTFGISDLKQQLDDAADIMRHHTGPIIFAGDLNTWSDERQQLVTQTLNNLGLHEAIYLDDKRTKAFGLALDQVWVRGVKIETTVVPELESSDHNPIIATLTIEQEAQ
ncbi:endonuclease/exonuclease/phosphatase family protein [Pseudoalteromonas sp. bablab_jr011]|uniref:endonuclease/exonuclease/phosphatase family protein n=1 Tax=Pseudoalteromonas sp. bablab_jr011 TaxID=2755062 RepID=UPI0018F6307C|nr:endonuclease/exonuclease/phosphatase family protein [Pseudoalteromonas sp. bablab_jr011]